MGASPPYTRILECIVGSTLHGTAVDDGLEDLDIMAVAIEAPSRILGFSTRDTWVERTKPEGVRSEAGDVDKTTYGLRKYLGLALKGNPTILLPLFAPEQHIRFMNDIGQDLRGMTPHILSRRMGSCFLGYLDQQLKRLMGRAGQKRCTRPELIERHGFDTKFAGHVIRLGLQGIELLSTGKLTLPMSEAARQQVRDVRLGRFPIHEVEAWGLDLVEQLKQTRDKSPLPEEPNTPLVEKWMLHTYLEYWS